MRETLEFVDAKSAADVAKDLHRMVASIDAALLIVSASGKIEITNQRLGDLLKLAPDALEGRQITDIFASPDGEDLIKRLRGAVEASAKPWSGVLEVTIGAAEGGHLSAVFSVIQPSARHISVLVVVSPVAQAADAANENAVVAQVQSLIANRAGRFAAGHLEMIGLDEVRTSLGDRWEKLAERVYNVADKILKSRLSKEDVFRRDANGNYIICFSQLTGEQAWFKAKALGQEIREALIGDDAEDQLAEFQLDRDTRQRLSDVKAETYEIEIPVDELDDIPDIMGVIKQKIDNAAVELRKQAGVLLAELSENCGVRFLGVRTLAGKPMPVQVAEFDTATQARVEQLRSIYNDAPKLLAQLDCMLLGTVVERLYHVDPKRLHLTVVEVQFGTLINPNIARRYFELCGSLIGKPAESLVIKIRNIPHDLPQGKVCDVIRTIRKYTRLVTIQLTQPTLDKIDIPMTGLSLVAFEFRDLSLMLKRHYEATKDLFEVLRQSKVRIVVDHVPDHHGLHALKSVAPDYYSMQPQEVGL